LVERLLLLGREGVFAFAVVDGFDVYAGALAAVDAGKDVTGILSVEHGQAEALIAAGVAKRVEAHDGNLLRGQAVGDGEPLVLGIELGEALVDLFDALEVGAKVASSESVAVAERGINEALFEGRFGLKEGKDSYNERPNASRISIMVTTTSHPFASPQYKGHATMAAMAKKKTNPRSTSLSTPKVVARCTGSPHTEAMVHDHTSEAVSPRPDRAAWHCFGWP
jgi:hypothetical protein